MRLLQAANFCDMHYYPFGMVTPGRSFAAADGYRFGFNGKESDAETYGSGNIYDYGFRIYNPRLGKFLSVDPLINQYSNLTPYQYASNNPTVLIDIDGLEGGKKQDNNGTGVLTTSKGDQILRDYSADVLYVTTKTPQSSYDDRCYQCEDFDYTRAYNKKRVYTDVKIQIRTNFYSNEEAKNFTENYKETNDQIEQGIGFIGAVGTEIILSLLGVPQEGAVPLSIASGFAVSGMADQHDVYVGRGYSIYEKYTLAVDLSSEDPSTNSISMTYTLQVYDNEGKLNDTVLHSRTYRVGNDPMAQELIRSAIDLKSTETTRDYKDVEPNSDE